MSFRKTSSACSTTSPGVRDSAVVGSPWNGEERVHAVLVLDPGARRGGGDPRRPTRRWTIIRRFAVMPSGRWRELPRTEGTRKLKRREIKQWVDAGGTQDVVVRRGDATSRWRRSSPVSPSRGAVTRETTLDELGLSSLERVELLMALEDRFQTTVDEGAYASADGGRSRGGGRAAGSRATRCGASCHGRRRRRSRRGRDARHRRTFPSNDQSRDFPTWNRRWPLVCGGSACRPGSCRSGAPSPG